MKNGNGNHGCNFPSLNKIENRKLFRQFENMKLNNFKFVMESLKFELMCRVNVSVLRIYNMDVRIFILTVFLSVVLLGIAITELLWAWGVIPDTTALP